MAITSMQVLVILGVSYLFGVQLATGILGVATIVLIGMMFGIGLTASLGGDGLLREKSRRFLLRLGLSFAADDFPQLRVGAVDGDARLDEFSGAIQPDNWAIGCCGR